MDELAQERVEHQASAAGLRELREKIARIEQERAELSRPKLSVREIIRFVFYHLLRELIQ